MSKEFAPTQDATIVTGHDPEFRKSYAKELWYKSWGMDDADVCLNCTRTKCSGNAHCMKEEKKRQQEERERQMNTTTQTDTTTVIVSATQPEPTPTTPAPTIPAQTAHKKYHEWTPEDENFLWEHYGKDWTSPQLAEKYGTSVSAIEDKMRKLRRGLAKNLQKTRTKLAQTAASAVIPAQPEDNGVLSSIDDMVTALNEISTKINQLRAERDAKLAELKRIRAAIDKALESQGREEQR